MKRFYILLMVVFILLLSTSLAMACLSTASSSPQGYVAAGYAYGKVVAKAMPNECFYGIGSTSNQYPMTSACTGTFKRNEGYIWGMTKYQDKIFFGTASNVACLVAENYLLVGGAIKDPDYVCEMSSSAYPNQDFRPPNLYMYTTGSGLQKLAVPAAAVPLLNATVGIRSGGVHPSGIVLMAGPMAKAGGTGINIFAFAGQNGAFLGAANLKIGENIRNIYTTNAGEVYIGVGGMEAGDGTGSVYKWKGNAAAIYGGDRSTLFAFEKVGSGLDGEAAQLAEHEGRLFTTTWPNRKDAANFAGLWMSPPLPLTANSASGWKKVWSADKYEPFTLAAKLYGGGALHSFGGYLYWGTMHVPGMTYFYFTQQAGGEPSNNTEKAILADEVNRSFSLFRGTSFGSSSPAIELLYGGYSGGYFRNFNPSTKKFYDQKNLMGLTPKYGPGGINNKYNNYCWSMNLYKNHLYVGTMDYSPLTQYFLGRVPPNATFGGDLFRFDSTTESAKKISDNGMGNENQYGIRTMVSDNDSLFLGTAGNSNLQPGGGWELIKLKETQWAEGFVYNGPYWAEAENMTKINFRTYDDTSVSEDRKVTCESSLLRSNTCVASINFSVDSNSYNVAIRYYDAGLKSTADYMKFYINGGQVGATRTLNGNRGWYTWHLDGVQINSGNKVELKMTIGSRSHDYRSAVDFVDFVPTKQLSGDPTGYTKCADEGGTCSFSGTADVAYGANGQFNYLYGRSGSIACNNDTFGDPIFGTTKACYYKSNNTPPPGPTPSPTTYGGDGNGIDLNLLQVGDFIMLSGVLSNTAIPGGFWTHAAIYIGNGQIVDAWSPSVRQTPASILQTASTAAIYRVNTTATVKQAAVAFAIAQIGKPYDFSWASIPPSGAKDVNSSSWYCSELIWAAYKKQGVELDSDSVPGSHVVPMELTQTGNVSRIAYSETPSTPTPTPTGVSYNIISKISGKCVDVYNVSTADGANVHQWNCYGGASQIWTLNQQGDGSYTMVAKHSGKCLDVEGVSTADAANIHQWSCYGSANQAWTLTPAGDGAYTIVSKNSGKCMEVYAGSTADGGNIVQWGCHGGDNQKWRLQQQ